MRTHYKKLLVSVVFLILVSSLTGASCRALFGSLQIKSSPEKATVFINGENTEKETPTNIRLPKGSYTLKLTKEGYLDYETIVQINTRQKTEVDVTLIPESSKIYKNEKYGYSFVYPEEAIIKEEDDKVTIRFDDNMEGWQEVQIFVSDNSENLPIEEWFEKDYENSPMYIPIVSKEKIKVAKINSLKVIMWNTTEIEYVYIPIENEVIEISFGDYKISESKYLDQFNQLLNSFTVK